MENQLRKLVYKYLDNTYEIDMDTLLGYQALCKVNNTRVSFGVIYDDVKDMFNLHAYNCGEYFDDWIDAASTRLNNQAVDDLYEEYAKVRTTPMPSSKIIRLKAIHDNNSRGNSKFNRHEYLSPLALSRAGD